MKEKMIPVLCAIVILISVGIAASDKNDLNPLAQPAVSVGAFKGTSTTDLLIHLPSDVEEARKIQVKAYNSNDTPMFTKNFFNLSAVNNTVSIQFDDLQRGDRVDVRLDSDKYGWLENSTKVLLRPDLVISFAGGIDEVPVGDVLPVNVSIMEVNGDLGSRANVTLLDEEIVLDTRDVSIDAGGTGSALFSTILKSRGVHNLSIRIIASSPAEYDETNNVYNLAVRAVSPDLAVAKVTAPVNIAIGERFEVLAEISELYGELGANATVALLENSAVLDIKALEIPAGSSGVVSLNGSLHTAGTHNMLVKILGSVPSDYFQPNNMQNFSITVTKPLGSLFFKSKYSYQNVSLNTSHYITTLGHVDNSEEIELKENEVLSFSISSNKSLSYPIDRIYLNITNEAGEGIVYEETGITPNGSNGTFTKYYPDSNALLTLTISSTGINLRIESVSNSSVKYSRGYLYWWFKGAQEWNTVTSSSKGKLLRAKEKLLAQVEVEDGSQLLAGSMVTGIVNKSYAGGWAENTTEGRFEQSRSVWIYSGSGETKNG